MRDFDPNNARFGSTPAVIGPLALGPLHLSNLTSVIRVGTSRLCQ
jgi:hypothetical protein